MAVEGQQGPGFRADQVTSHVRRITDPLGVHLYLVEGSDRALLVDTGHGVGPLPEFISGLTVKPVTVVLTHGHVDHAFGAAWFHDVRMNRLDLPTLAAHRPLSEQLTAEARASGRPVADPPDPDSLGDLEPEDVFELGGTTVVALRAAGHTPGSMAFLIPQERVLITGDAANQFTFLFHAEAAGVAAFQESMERLHSRTAGLYDRVLVSHGPGEAPASLLQDLIALCAKIRRRSDDAVPFDFGGASGLIARRAAGPDHVDDHANIVYNPRSLEADGLVSGLDARL